jgi:hypothetical protein
MNRFRWERGHCIHGTTLIPARTHRKNLSQLVKFRLKVWDEQQGAECATKFKRALVILVITKDRK